MSITDVFICDACTTQNWIGRKLCRRCNTFLQWQGPVVNSVYVPMVKEQNHLSVVLTLVRELTMKFDAAQNRFQEVVDDVAVLRRCALRSTRCAITTRRKLNLRSKKRRARRARRSLCGKTEHGSLSAPDAVVLSPPTPTACKVCRSVETRSDQQVAVPQQ